MRSVKKVGLERGWRGEGEGFRGLGLEGRGEEMGGKEGGRGGAEGGKRGREGKIGFRGLGLVREKKERREK